MPARRRRRQWFCAANPFLLFQQQLDRVSYLGRVFKGQADLLSGFGRKVGGVDHFQDGAAVLAGHERRFVLPHAGDEMRKLLRVALIEGFLKDRERPALGRAGFFRGVVVAVRAVGQRGIPAE